MSSGYTVTAISLKRPDAGVSSGRNNNRPLSKFILDGETFDRAKNMSDSDILINSLNYAEEKSKDTVAGKLLSALPSLFLAAVPALFGILQKGPLSAKLASAATTAVIFGGSSILCDKVDDISNRIKAKSPKADEASKNHPFLTFAGNVIAKSALLAGAFVAASKGAGAVQKHFAPSVKSISNSLNLLGTRIDASRAGKRVSKMSDSFQKFVSKHPKLSNFASKHSYFAPIALLFGWMGFSDFVAGRVEKNQVKFASERAEDLLLLRSAAKQIGCTESDCEE